MIRGLLHENKGEWGETVTDIGGDSEGITRLRKQFSTFERKEFGKDSLTEVSLKGENSNTIKKIAETFNKEIRFFRPADTEPELRLYSGAMVVCK